MTVLPETGSAQQRFSNLISDVFPLGKTLFNDVTHWEQALALTMEYALPSFVENLWSAPRIVVECVPNLAIGLNYEERELLQAYLTYEWHRYAVDQRLNVAEIRFSSNLPFAVLRTRFELGKLRARLKASKQANTPFSVGEIRGLRVVVADFEIANGLLVQHGHHEFIFPYSEELAELLAGSDPAIEVATLLPSLQPFSIVNS